MAETRRQLIERILRATYGGIVRDDAEITENQVSLYINDGLSAMVVDSFKKSQQIEGVGYVNSSFYTNYKNIPIVADPGTGNYKLDLPSVPPGIGRNEGMQAVRLMKDGVNSNRQSIPAMLITTHQADYWYNLPRPNRVLAYYNGSEAFLMPPKGADLTGYTANVRMISGGNSTDWDAPMDVPQEYIGGILDYVVQRLTAERMKLKDNVNDGVDIAP